LQVENAYLAADDSMLFSVAWEGDLLLPGGRVERTGDVRAGLLVRWGAARENVDRGEPAGQPRAVHPLMWTKQIDVDGPAVCEDLAPVFAPERRGRALPTPVGWTIGCYEGKIVRIDDDGRTLWETRLTRLDGGEGYAYLFGITPALDGAVFTTIKSQPGFELGDRTHENPERMDSTLLAALETDSGEVRWWLPTEPREDTGIGIGRPSIEPETDTLVFPTDAWEGVSQLLGLDPRSGEVLWTVRYVFEPANGRDRLTVRSVERTTSGRWWVSGTHRIDGLYHGFLMEIDPADQHRARPVLNVPHLGYSHVGVVSLGGDQMLAVLAGFESPVEVFGQRIEPSRQRDSKTIVHLTWRR
jgi:hypothetical protein